MKRRRPVLELHTNSTFPKAPSLAASSSSPVIAPGIQSLVSYSEDSDSECNISNPSIGDTQKPVTAWQVCIDENTGYTYYWNIDTNQVTWEIPPEYLAYETALQQYNTSHLQVKNGIDNSNMTGESWNSTPSETSKSSSDNKSYKNGKELFPAYGPLLEDELTFEEIEAKKMACARKRLLSYKSDKLKPKVEETTDKIPVIIPQTPASSKGTITSQKTDIKIPFIPTAEEIKEHPIFSGSSALSGNPKNSCSSNYMNGIGDVRILSTNENQSTSHQKPNPPANASINENKRLTIIAENYSDSEEEDDEDEDLDDVIISRLRKKALLLKELGGDVPKEIVSVLDQSKTAEDIIAEIEKEIPSDQNEEELPPVPGTETFENKSEVKPLFPITDFIKNTENEETKLNCRPAPINQKNKMKNIQKIKLSARARELIKTSLLTAKARATNFVETEDGLKPAEEVAKMNESKTKAHSDKREDTTTIPESETTEQKRHKDELGKLKAEIDKLSSLNVNEKEAASTAKGVPMSPSIVSESRVSTSINVSESSDKSKEDMFSFQKSFVILNPKRPKVLDDIETQDSCSTSASTLNPTANISLVTKCEEFLQSVKKSVTETASMQAVTKKTKSGIEESQKPPTTSSAISDIDIDEILNTKNKDTEKNTVDLAQLVMEKLKFLSDGKGAVAEVQVMAIQIETLFGAWQTGALALQYLSDWLDASAVHLKKLEEAAAPDGWLCEWDRSYGRYYYRDKATGTIQWDFPEITDDDVVLLHKKTSSKKTDGVFRPATPPPPVISNGMVPPPPPIISAHDSRKRRNSPAVENSDLDAKRKLVTQLEGPSNLTFSTGTATIQSVVPPLSSSPVIAPPLPAVPPKSPTPPPPPPSSPPPPPPPPPVISSPTTTSNEVNQNLIESGKCESMSSNPDKIHEVLDSFYSDIASIEATFSSNSNDALEKAPTPPVVEELNETKETDNAPSPKVEEKVIKKKKKVKLDSSLSLKKKGLQGLVAKWQKVSSDI